MIPVDMVCRGMTLIAAALIQRRNAARVSTCDFRDQSVQHGPQHRAYWPGASQTLSRATRTGTLAAHAIRYDSRFEKPLPENERARAEGGDLCASIASAAILQFKQPLVRQERDLGPHAKN